MNSVCIEKCPNCGTELDGLVLTVNPPIFMVKCPEFGFKSTREQYEELKKHGVCKTDDEHPVNPGKPPIGVSPYYVSISARICELCEAIKRFSTEKDKHDKIKLWCGEIMCLNEVDRAMKKYERQEKEVMSCVGSNPADSGLDA